MRVNTSPEAAFDQIRRVFVVDTIPAYRAGILAHLRQQGLDATDEAPPTATPHDDEHVLVVHTVRDEEDLASIQRLATGGHRLLALITDNEVRTHAAALLAGATGTAPWDAEAEQITASLVAAAHGQSTLPASIAAALAERVPQGFPDGWLSTRDIQLLQAIREGHTVPTIAEELDLSQRTTHRLLADLYAKLGAASRLDAVLIAQRRGVID